MTRLPDAARSILEAGTLCYLAAPSPPGPHVTPVVYVLDGGRLWGTTSRGTTKARRWRRQALAGGLVRSGERALTFRGPVTLYDALDASTWPASILRGPQVARASARFTLKNAKFFAGYARDVTRIPLAWTPPGRVIFSVDLSSGLVSEDGRVVERWGAWGDQAGGLSSYRGAAADLPASALPAEVGDLALGFGDGALALPSPDGPIVLPAAWSSPGGAYHATLPAALLHVAGTPARTLASLVVDRASAWRAAHMRGVLLRGPASVYLLDRVRSGATRLRAQAGDPPGNAAVVRLLPRTVVWWSGWTSGTVGRS